MARLGPANPSRSFPPRFSGSVVLACYRVEYGVSVRNTAPGTRLSGNADCALW